MDVQKDTIQKGLKRQLAAFSSDVLSDFVHNTQIQR